MSEKIKFENIVLTEIDVDNEYGEMDLRFRFSRNTIIDSSKIFDSMKENKDFNTKIIIEFEGDE